MEKKLLPKGLRVRKSPEIKLKDKAGRNFIVLHLKDFGFIPDDLIIEKVHGATNKFVVMAVLTEAELKKEKPLPVPKKDNGQPTQPATQQKA